MKISTMLYHIDNGHMAVLLNEPVEIQSIVGQAGFRCFTDADDFRRCIEREILASEVMS